MCIMLYPTADKISCVHGSLELGVITIIARGLRVSETIIYKGRNFFVFKYCSFTIILRLLREVMN